MYTDKELNEFETHGFPAKRTKLVVIADNLRRQVEALKKVAYHRNQNCEKCGHTWLDDGLNPAYCPYCKLYETRKLAAQVDCTCLPYAEPNDGMCQRCMVLQDFDRG